MSNGFEQLKAAFAPASFSATPELHESPLMAAHPYPGWMSPGGGDSRALLPYVDADIGEHHARHEAEGGSESNPIGTGMSIVDGLHVAAEAAEEGGTSATTFGGLAARMGHHASRVVAGEGSAAETGLAGATAVAAPLSIGGGIMDIIEGAGDWKRGNKLDGGYSVASGIANVGSGVCGIAGLAGVGGAAAAAPVAATLGTAIKVGRYGDGEAKDLGWFHDESGEALTASQWAGQLGRSVNESLTESGHPYLGSTLGVATTAGATLANVGIVPAAAAIGAGHSIGDAAAHHHRANHYASYEGIQHVDGGAASLADYDDQKAAAIERAKRQHPERFEPNRNPTYGQWLAQLDATMKGAK